MSYELKVYQAYIEYFFASHSGYGTVNSFYGNLFSTKEKCLEYLEKIRGNYEIKCWSILEYSVDTETVPVIVEQGPVVEQGPIIM